MKRAAQPAIAVCLLATLTGCAQSGSGQPRLSLPPLDSSITEPCRDPGVDRNPRIAIAQTRLELAKCEIKRKAAVDAYEGAAEAQP